MTTLMHLIRFYFQKTSFIPLCFADYIIKAFFKKRCIKKSHFHLHKPGLSVKCSQDAKKRSVIKSTRPWECFSSTHKKQVELCLSEKGCHFRKLLELLKSSTFASMLKALTNTFYTVGAGSARSQRAAGQQARHNPADLFTTTSEGLKLQPEALPRLFIQQTYTKQGYSH